MMAYSVPVALGQDLLVCVGEIAYVGCYNLAVPQAVNVGLHVSTNHSRADL